jgi:CIC family chloride channel protein
VESADQGRAPQRDEDEDRTGLVRLALAGLAVGALAGLVGSAFHIVLDHADVLRGAVLAWSHAHPRIGWVVPVALAAAAAFVARWLVARFAPEASGSGVQHVEAVIRGDARSISAAVLPVKFVGGALAIGAGLALGREGPTVQMGATLGHLLARGLRLRPADARVLLAAGAGAGLAAAFNAPLAGAIFVFEELLRRFELRAVVATLAACSGGLAVMRAIVGNRNVFSVPPLEVDLFPGYLLFFAFGGLIGLLGLAYSRAVVGALDLVERFGRVPAARAAAVGAIVGLVTFPCQGSCAAARCWSRRFSTAATRSRSCSSSSWCGSRSARCRTRPGFPADCSRRCSWSASSPARSSDARPRPHGRRSPPRSPRSPRSAWARCSPRSSARR